MKNRSKFNESNLYLTDHNFPQQRRCDLDLYIQSRGLHLNDWSLGIDQNSRTVHRMMQASCSKPRRWENKTNPISFSLCSKSNSLAAKELTIHLTKDLRFGSLDLEFGLVSQLDIISMTESVNPTRFIYFPWLLCTRFLFGLNWICDLFS